MYVCLCVSMYVYDWDRDCDDDDEDEDGDWDDEDHRDDHHSPSFPRKGGGAFQRKAVYDYDSTPFLSQKRRLFFCRRRLCMTMYVCMYVRMSMYVYLCL